MKISPVYDANYNYICGECSNSGYCCQIITADNGWRFIICGDNDKCFNKSVASAREVDDFCRKNTIEKLRYLSEKSFEESYIKIRLRDEYHSQVQDSLLLRLCNQEAV